MRRAQVAVLAAIILFSISAQAAVTQSDVPLDFTGFVSCANGGAGESVHLTGSIHEVSSSNVTASGTFHALVKVNYQNASGVGLSTGDIYRGVGIGVLDINTATLPFESTSQSMFQMIGPGPNNNFLASGVVHVTIDANGVVTAQVFIANFACQ